MNKELESFVKDYLANNGRKWQADKLYDTLKKAFPDLSNTELTIIIIDLLIDGELSIYTRTREWFEKSKKEHCKGNDCEFASLNKYFEAIEKYSNGDTDVAAEALKDAKEMMKSEAANGCPFVKDLFENIINDGFDKLDEIN